MEGWMNLQKQGCLGVLKIATFEGSGFLGLKKIQDKQSWPVNLTPQTYPPQK